MIKHLILTSLLLLTANVYATTATSLSKSQDAIQSSEGKAAFRRIMDGASNLQLGEKLPEGITQNELSQIIFQQPFSKVSKDSSCEFGGLAAYPWPGQTDLYIGIGSQTNCDATTQAPAKIYLTVFQITKPHQFKIIAHSASPFVFSSKDSDGNELNYDELVRIDHTQFRIAPTQYAFGIRVAANQGYAGGFSYNENLVLFVIKDNIFLPVLNEPIYELKNFAGEWNKDGTRQHDIQEQEWVVIIKPTLHEGHYGLTLKKTKGGQGSTDFIWSNNSYRKSP
jgi:hypothetical protein